MNLDFHTQWYTDFLKLDIFTKIMNCQYRPWVTFLGVPQFFAQWGSVFAVRGSWLGNEIQPTRIQSNQSICLEDLGQSLIIDQAPKHKCLVQSSIDIFNQFLLGFEPIISYVLLVRDQLQFDHQGPVH